MPLLGSSTARTLSLSVTSPFHKIFERSCELGLWRLTANRISEIFGVRLTKKIEHGHHVFRMNFKNALLRLRQYERFFRFLRNELLSKT